jgi:hypothetical protein
MYLQSIKSVKHNAAKSVNRSFLKKSRHIGFGAFIVHSSMMIYVFQLHRAGIQYYFHRGIFLVQLTFVLGSIVYIFSYFPVSLSLSENLLLIPQV